MNHHTLKENQVTALTDQLESLLPKITEESRHEVGAELLRKLKVCRPHPGQLYASLSTSDSEEDLLQILCKLTWGRATPKDLLESQKEPVATQKEDSNQ